MDEAAFWEMVDNSRSIAKYDLEKQIETLVAMLVEHSVNDIWDCDRILVDLNRKSYSYDLWAAAEIISNDVDEHSFDDFQFWLIAQGKDIFYRALENPESLVEIADRIDQYGIVTLEVMGNIALNAYEKKTGKSSDFMINQREYGSEINIRKRDWNQDTVRSKYPRLATRFPEAYLFEIDCQKKGIPFWRPDKADKL